jgi:acetone carboxylase gamma subunit
MVETDEGGETVVTKDDIRSFVRDDVAWETVENVLELDKKDTSRFEKYMEVLREEVDLDDELLLRIGDHLYIVRDDEGDRVVKCDCGYGFGDYRQNWKLEALINVRRTREEMRQIYVYDEATPREGVQEIREYICPGCGTQLSVEVVTPQYPALFPMLPDLDSFYGEWVNSPLEDTDNYEFEDRTGAKLEEWAETQ